MRNILRVPGFFRTIFSEPLGEENIRKNPGTSKIFPYCTRNCLITSLSWHKKYSAKFWTFPIMSVVFLFLLLPTSCFEFFFIRNSNVELSNFWTFESSNVKKIFKDPKTLFEEVAEKSDISCITVFLSCLALGHSLLFGIKFIQRIHSSRSWFNRLRKTNWQTLLWKFQIFYNFYNEMVWFCLDYVNRPIVKENFRHFRHTTGRMKLIMTTGRDNRFVFRGSNFKKSRSWSYYSYWT